MLKSILIFCINFLCCQFLFGQLVFSTLKHNFGDLESYDNRFVDITVVNKSVKDGYILSVRKPSEVVYIQNKALVAKDSTLILRFQVNPQKKGRFSYTIQIYTSDQAEPHILTLTGNLLNLEIDNASNYTACPDFNARPISKNYNFFDLTVVTIDAETKEEIEGSQVNFIQNGFSRWKEYTDKNGKIKKQGSIGFAYFEVNKQGYLPFERGTYVNNDRNRVIIELTKKPFEKTEESVLTHMEEIVIDDSKQDSIIKQLDSLTSISFEQLPEDNFDPRYFHPVNVTFILDVSSSMNQGEKMELMKYSLNQLSELMRQEDKISIVTYASKAKVLLPPTVGTDKEAVRLQVESLRASGMTAGGDGIKMGFEQAEEGYIPNGINHVFIITDGAFNHQTYDYKKIIKKYVKKHIHLSVVGILNDSKAETSMREVAKLGNGEYIPVFNLVDAQQNIRQLVRKIAFISK